MHTCPNCDRSLDMKDYGDFAGVWYLCGYCMDVFDKEEVLEHANLKRKKERKKMGGRA